MHNVPPPEPALPSSVPTVESGWKASQSSGVDGETIVVQRAVLERVAVLLTKDYRRLARREIKQALDTLGYMLGHSR